MVRIIVVILLLLGAQFSATLFSPAQRGKAWILWPFAADSKSILGFSGGIPKQSNKALTPVLIILAGLSTLGFLAAIASLFGFLVPISWWAFLVPAAAILSMILHIIYIGPLAIAPILVDLALSYGMFFLHWTAASLH